MLADKVRWSLAKGPDVLANIRLGQKWQAVTVITE